MSSQLKRMTFSIYMDPGALESDRYAVGVLQNWYQRARKIQDGSEEFDFSKSRFHKDIYLSGMFMYVLAPNLCKAIANALGPEQVSMTTLRHAFASCGFNLGEGSASAQPAADVMIEQIVARLSPGLARVIPAGWWMKSFSVWVSKQLCPLRTVWWKRSSADLGSSNQPSCGMSCGRECRLLLTMNSWPRRSRASCHLLPASRTWRRCRAAFNSSLVNWKSSLGLFVSSIG